jgi:O-antigen ligase
MKDFAAEPVGEHPGWDRFGLIAVCLLAVSVSMGAALVSLSEVLVLIAFIGAMVLDGPATVVRKFRQAPWTIYAVCLALAWMMLSFAWTEASLTEALQSAMRHLRLAWLIAVFYIVRTRDRAMLALQCLVLGQAFVLASSWSMWAGVPIPWAKTVDSVDKAIVFTSTLEQPVMSSLMLLVLWYFRDHWSAKVSPPLVWGAMLVTVINVLFVMTGRTGFLVMLLLLALAVYWELPVKLRWLALLTPVLLAVTLFEVSPRFHQRVGEIERDVLEYQKGNVQTSQGERLDYWKHSLLSIPERPVIGHGVGSWRLSYVKHGGVQPTPPSNPHQQYLLWAVEAGGIGLVLFLGFLGSLCRDALKLEKYASQALLSTIAVAAVMGLMNCPFFGVGMGEFFLVMMGCLLCSDHAGGALAPNESTS